MEIDYLQILDSSNNVLKEYHFTGSIFMDQTGTYYDYGLIRSPTSILYGTRNYEGMNAPEGECWLSGEVSNYVYDLFAGTGKYLYLQNNWGSNTQPSTVYSRTDTTERYYDYSAVFYKGHIWIFGNNCDHPDCPLMHWGLWNDDGTQGIADYDIDDEVIEVMDALNKFAGTHDFVFIWACSHGSNEKVGVFNEDHSSGLLSSWMHIDPNTLSNNGYLYPDYSDHVFISFEWLSIWYMTPTPAESGTWNYGHWAYLFYYYALQGYSINAALDQASRDTHDGSSFVQCQLYNGYWQWNPINSTWDLNRMRVWGDGNHKLPR
jgi:hypothetical protein